MPNPPKGSRKFCEMIGGSGARAKSRQRKGAGKGKRPAKAGRLVKTRSQFRAYFAAVTMISTLYFGAASCTSTVARAGVLPGETQASHTAFISGNVFMSVM